MTDNVKVLASADQAMSYLGGPVIEVIVGIKPQQKSFFLYEGLLAARSRYCRNHFKTAVAIDEHWQTLGPASVKLPEDDPEIFKSYVQILHQRRIPKPESLSGVINVAARNGEEANPNDVKALLQEYLFLAKLYVFCDKMQDCESKCLVIAGFTELIHKPREDGKNYAPSFETVQCVYDGTQDDDPMRSLLVDLYAATRDSLRILSFDEDDLPNVFLLKVTKRMLSDTLVEDEGNEGQAEGDLEAAPYCTRLRVIESVIEA